MEEINNQYGGQTRVRVCGILIKDNKILLINHKGIGSKGEYLLPPGGGVGFLESIEEALKREFLEETGLHVSVSDFLGIHEYINNPLHAIELFYKVDCDVVHAQQGYDPETKFQILGKPYWMKIPLLKTIETEKIHPFLLKIQ